MTYDEIISQKNIETAYLSVVSQFEKKSKNSTYRGYDGLTIKNYDLHLSELINQIHKELIDFDEISPAIKMSILKSKKPGRRPIFIHTIKERVKAQAIYQIVAPIFDKHFSDYLFSHRSSHPYYEAAKSVAKRYKKFFKDDFVLIGDISDYSGNIDKNILKEKIEKIGLDKKTNKLINLFVDSCYSENGIKKHLEKGIVHGQPLSALFDNIYINDIDNYVGKKVSLYRRVGDDFIILDKNINKINEQKKYILEKLTEYKIPNEKQKISVAPASHAFNFLGYKFENGKISISLQSENKIKNRIKTRLKYRPINIKSKISILKKIMFYKDPMELDFSETIKHYSQASDTEQFRRISEFFFKRLTIYFFGSYSMRNQKLTKIITEEEHIPSLFKLFIDKHRGITRKYR